MTSSGLARCAFNWARNEAAVRSKSIRCSAEFLERDGIGFSTARYAGDGNFFGSTNNLSPNQVINAQPVAVNDYLQRYPTVQVSVFAMAASVLFLGLAALSEAWPTRLGLVSAVGWGAVLFVGLSSAVGYIWWLFALKHLPATRVTVFLALNPVTAAILGQVLLGEPMDRWTVMAIALIALGLWLATAMGSRGRPR